MCTVAFKKTKYIINIVLLYRLPICLRKLCPPKFIFIKKNVKNKSFFVVNSTSPITINFCYYLNGQWVQFPADELALCLFVNQRKIIMLKMLKMSTNVKLVQNGIYLIWKHNCIIYMNDIQKGFNSPILKINKFNEVI